MFQISKFSTGFMVGFGAGFVTRDLINNGPSMVRPIIKGVLKAGVGVLEKSRESIANLVETVEDLLAEVRTDHVSKVVNRNVNVSTAAAPSPGPVGKKSKTAAQNS